MTIHDDARAAGEAATAAVYDTALDELAARATAAETALLDATAGVERLQAELAAAAQLETQLRARIAELEKAAEPPHVPVAGVTEPTYPVPAGAREVTPATIEEALASVGAGEVLVARGGAYRPGLRMSRPVRIQAYPGETPVVDGKGTAMWAAIVKARVELLGLVFQNYAVTNQAAFEYGLLFPAGSAGSLIENTIFRDFAGGSPSSARAPINVFNKGALTIRQSLFERSGQCHITGNTLDGLLVERSIFRGGNTSGQNFTPVTGAMKVTRARNTVFRDNIIDGMPGAAGVWFDESCIGGAVVNNVILNCGAVGVLAEASAHIDIVNNRINGCARGLWAFDASQVRMWNNAIAGSSLWQIGVQQDHRRNPDAALRALDATWVSKDIEIVNNDLADDYATFQIQAIDDSKTIAPEYTAEQMISRLEGNRAARGSRGTQIGWGRLGNIREALTIEQLDAKYSQVARRNASPAAVPMPADLAGLVDAASGAAQIGPVALAPIPA